MMLSLAARVVAGANRLLRNRNICVDKFHAPSPRRRALYAAAQRIARYCKLLTFRALLLHKAQTRSALPRRRWYGFEGGLA